LSRAKVTCAGSTVIVHCTEQGVGAPGSGATLRIAIGSDEKTSIERRITPAEGQDKAMADTDIQGANRPQEISAQELERMLSAEQPPLVIDVREPFELASGAIPGSIHIPMGAIALRLTELPRDRTMVVYCHLGERSWSVVQFLARRGFREVKSLRGGIEAWQAFKKLNK